MTAKRSPHALSSQFCANRLCRKPLHNDPVILITTAHVRRFCHVECIIEGYHAHLAEISVTLQEEFRRGRS